MRLIHHHCTDLVKFLRRINNISRITSTFSQNMASKNAVLLLADGAEEMEAVITADVLRRAGITVTITSITGTKCIKCSRDVNICADTNLEEVKSQKFDVVILPGGLAGSKALATSKEVGELLQQQEKEGRIIAAICAAPTALKAHSIGNKKRITSYPSMKDQLTDTYEYIEETVVTDGNLITSRGPATAFDFGLAIVEKLVDKDTALRVATGMLYNGYK